MVTRTTQRKTLAFARWMPLLPLLAVPSMALAQATAPAKTTPAPTAAPVPTAAAGAWDPTTQPLPAALSDQAKAAIAANAAENAQNAKKLTSLADQRAFIDQYQVTFGALQQKKYAVDISDGVIAGVKVRNIKAKGAKVDTRRVFLNLHGGGFITDSGSLTENIPIAALTNIPVVAVLYRLSPENKFPAAVDDALAVYRELLKTHKPGDIGVYGTSAGAVLGPQLLARIRAEGLPMPAMLGMFSGDVDLSRHGDTITIQKIPEDMMTAMYLGGKTPATDPKVSPLLGELKGFPPTMCLTSSRDFFLSSTSNYCRALELAGVENKLVVFDGLPHAFWAYLDTPESDQAFQLMARWLSSHFGKK
jgi:acetyl esterase/lipase